MKKIHNILAIALLLTSSAVMAQQESVISFYRQHMNLVNPAYVGVDSMSIASSSLRKQWTGVDEAPETQTVSFGTPLGRNLGFGMTVIHDRTFIEKQTYVSVDFLQKELEVVEMEDIQGESDDFDIVFDPGNGKTKKKILFNKPDLAPSNAIKEELISFHNAIRTDSIPVVSGEDGLRALEIAYLIIDRLKKTD